MAARNPFASSLPDTLDPYAFGRYSRSAPLSTGYYFVRNLLLIGAVAGGLVALYRNDVFRDLARRAGQEQRYLALEQFLVGRPGWGTPRSMEAVLKEGSAAEAAAMPMIAAATEAPAAARPPEEPADAREPGPSATTEATAPLAPTAREPQPVASPAAAPPSPPPVATSARRAPADPMAPVSFDSLPLLTKGGSAPRATSSEPAPSRAAAPAPRAVAEPSPRPAAHGAKAVRVSLAETSGSSGFSPFARHPAPAPEPEPAAAPPPRPAKPEKPAAPATKVTDTHPNDNPLMAAVRSAVRAHPAKHSVAAAK